MPLLEMRGGERDARDLAPPLFAAQNLVVATLTNQAIPDAIHPPKQTAALSGPTQGRTAHQISQKTPITGNYLFLLSPKI